MAGIADGLSHASSLVLTADEEVFAFGGQHANVEALQLGVSDVMFQLAGSRVSIRLSMKRTLGMGFLLRSVAGGGKAVAFLPVIFDCTRKKKFISTT